MSQARRGRTGNLKREPCPSALRTCDMNFALMGVYHTLYQGEPEPPSWRRPGAVRGGALKFLKQPRDFGFRDDRPLILDRYLDGLFPQFPTDRNRGPGRAKLDGIGNQIFHRTP